MVTVMASGGPRSSCVRHAAPLRCALRCAPWLPQWLYAVSDTSYFVSTGATARTPTKHPAPRLGRGGSSHTAHPLALPRFHVLLKSPDASGVEEWQMLLSTRYCELLSPEGFMNSMTV